MIKLTIEEVYKAQDEDKIIKVTSDTYPMGLIFKPWESFRIYFVAHKNIEYWLAK